MENLHQDHTQSLKWGKMLKHRIIPILLYDGDFCVHTTRFKRPARRIGPMLQYTSVMANRDTDELILLDIEATRKQRPPNFNRIAKYVEMLACPVSYGGGIRSLHDIRVLMKECGVDKVVIGNNFQLIPDAANKFGKQSIVYALDVKCNAVYNYRGLSTVEDWAERIQDLGAGEMIVTDIEQQGTMLGYNNLLIQRLAKVLKVPLIANGGCGGVGDMVIALTVGADAVAASSIFTLRGLTPQGAARALSKAGYPTRVSPLAQGQEGHPEAPEPQPEGPTEDA